MVSKFPSSNTATMARSVLAIEVIWLSGASCIGSIIPRPVMLTGIEAIWKWSSCTFSAPNIDGLKELAKLRSKGVTCLWGGL